MKEEEYKKAVADLKELQLQLLDNNEHQLKLLRTMLDLEFSIQHIVNYEESVIIKDLEKDIDDSLALSFSLKNMLKTRYSIEGIERLSQLLECFCNTTDDIHDKLERYSLFNK